MTVDSIRNLASALSQARTADAVAIAVLKKANEIETQTAQQLIQALPQPNAGVTSALGNNVNTFA